MARLLDERVRVQQKLWVKLRAKGGVGKGKNNGILRGWIDGKQVWEKTDMRFRDSDALKMETVWLNIYHGGAKPVPAKDIYVYFDNMVIARKYIGPAILKRPERKPKSKSSGSGVINPKKTDAEKDD